MVQTLSTLPLVSKLEGMLQTTYTYLSFSLKRHLEQCDFAKLLETKGLKLLCNVKIRWISMLSLAKWVLLEYRFLVVRMNDDMHIMVTTKTNMQYLCDVEAFLSLTCIMPFLGAMHALIKFAQAQACFVCDFIIFVNMYYVKLYNMYFDLEKKYSHEHFKAFLDLHENTSN